MSKLNVISARMRGSTMLKSMWNCAIKTDVIDTSLKFYAQTMEPSQS